MCPFHACWRFDGETPQDGFVPLWIETWGNAFVDSTGRCRYIEGNATFSLANSGPFIALIESEERPQIQRINQYVEKNLERVTDLILTIAKNISPVAMKTFTDQGLYQPLNAHLVFFRDYTVLINDLIFLKKLWDEGLPSYRTPPLRESVDKPDLYALHPWRGLEASQTLSNQLAGLIGNINHLTSTDLVYKQNTLRLIANWRILTIKQSNLIDDDQEIVMNLSTAYLEWEQKTLSEGELKGTQKIIMRLVNQRFGEIGQPLVEQIRNLSTEQLEELTDVLLTLSNTTDLEQWLQNRLKSVDS